MKDTRYGFQIPLPGGWSVFAGDKTPLAESADLFLWPGYPNGQSASVQILVCPATAGACSPPARSASATGGPAELAGTAGTLLRQPNMQCAMRTPEKLRARCGFEYDEWATKGKYTYEVIGEPLVPQTLPPPQFTQVLRGWTWLNVTP